MDNNKVLSHTLKRIRSYINEQNEEGSKVVKYRTPDELKNAIDLEIANNGVDEPTFLGLIDQYLEYSAKTGNPQFFNQLYSGFNFPAFVGEILTSLTNTSMYTYEVAPVATMVEIEMIRLMNSFTAYEKGDGIFLTGGSNGNLVAMLSARNQIFPEGRFEGYDRNQKLVAFVNEFSHYSLDTAANIIGIGSDQVIKVKTDENGKIIPAELEREIKLSLDRGEKPFFAVATCGTTLLGAYDPIDQMAFICKKYNIWLHADGSFGGSVLLSGRYRHLMNGIEKTDSLVWNPHKLMNIPLICSVLLVKKSGTLERNLTDINTDYIYHDIDPAEDLGKKSIQCGRRVDAVKLWLAWKYFGISGYENRINHLIEMALYAEKAVIDHPKLQLFVPRQSFAICFKYIPKGDCELDEFNLKLRESLRKKGLTLVNFGYFKEELVIRLVMVNGDLRKRDIDRFFNNLMKEAVNLEKKMSVAHELS